MIYFLRAGNTIKIGYAEHDVAGRVKSLQTGNPEKLQLLSVLPGTRQTEADLHRRFARCRVNGEWFAANEELLTFIDQLQEPVSMTSSLVFTNLNPTTTPPPRLSSLFRGFDAVLGGGFVPGSTTLLSGDPGAGKSTLLLQIAAYIGCCGYRSVYVTAEEAAQQVQLRAARMGLERTPVRLAATHDAPALLAALADAPPAFLVVDSLQRFIDPAITAPRGTPTQTCAVLAQLIAYAHAHATVLVVVSHVNKSSRASGTNDLQHDVDVLLHLHAVADRRVLRAIKNRYGPTAQEAIFRMTKEGIRE